jgi:hypothetical protein
MSLGGWGGLVAVIDFTFAVGFVSRRGPSQWICRDLPEIRIRPTHYTTYAALLGSLVVERSVDGKNWTEIDRYTNPHVFRTAAGTRPFEVVALVFLSFHPVHSHRNEVRR